MVDSLLAALKGISGITRFSVYAMVSDFPIVFQLKKHCR